MSFFRHHASFDRLARLAARVVGARAAMLGVCDSEGVCVVGRDGVGFTTLPANWSLHFLVEEGRELVYIANVQRSSLLNKHPIRVAMPTARSLIYVPFETGEPGRHGGILIVDPEHRWPLKPNITSALTEMGFLASELYQEFGDGSHEPDRGGFEEAPRPPQALEPVSRFLLDTLVKGQSWRTRGNVAYSTIRKWRAPIKKYQMHAVAALKAAPPDAFVAQVASEMTSVARGLLGAKNISAVVNVPCGHSKGEACLAHVLASAVARGLSVEHVEAFARQRRKGSSHPSQNASLPGFVVARPPKGTVLVIDDVVTSGRHIEQAVSALRTHADHVAALAWIGPK
ncbi:MAG: phosphoribosyltransferase [Hyphomicrobiaceae bacterium]|nr:phosphoribosyltransferase [Hyphomicrobiaceae bacterium]